MHTAPALQNSLAPALVRAPIAPISLPLPGEGPFGEPLTLPGSPQRGAGEAPRCRAPPSRRPTSAKGTAAVTSPPPPALPQGHDLRPKG